MAQLLTSYVTPSVLRAAPTGISWNSLPTSKTGQSADATVMDICWRATSRVDAYCGTPLRATINTEQVEGPDFYMTIDGAGARITLSRPPVVKVTGITVQSTANFTAAPTVVTPSTQWRVQNPLMGEYGSMAPDSSGVLPYAVRLASGWVNWSQGRNGYLVTVTYVNGWPHAGLTSACAAGDTTLVVDDCTGMTGMAITIRDSVNTEVVQIATASATSGPGTLTLAAGTPSAQYPHDAGVVATTLPQVIELAAIKFATDEALLRGAMTISAPAMPSQSSSTGAPAATLTESAELLCHPFRRVI